MMPSTAYAEDTLVDHLRMTLPDTWLGTYFPDPPPSRFAVLVRGEDLSDSPYITQPRIRVECYGKTSEMAWLLCAEIHKTLTIPHEQTMHDGTWVSRLETTGPAYQPDPITRSPRWVFTAVPTIPL